MLGGVRVPHDHGLIGHSDADVALHALVDALLGALGAGDIGQHFPPTDERWRGADSALFVAEARRLIAVAGGAVVNVDLTIIGERPRVGPHRDAIRARVAGLLGTTIQRVNIKATTTERLGFTGRGEGLAAQASAALRLRAP
jgi:2-C-methyl-D-erythritol 4-phosphate cytidylyltransferase/2-C-methyl-D-erythritol 2,4-cyclodiphosphate synthase